MPNSKFPWWKFLAGFLFYLLFHEIDRLIPGVIGALLGEKFESVYTHMKMLFYAYLMVCAIDYAFRRKQIKLEPFLYARMLILAAVPWMMIAIYYIPEAVGIPLPGRTELIMGIISTLIGLYFCIRLEEPFEAMPLRGSAKGMIILAFLSAIITYSGFSFHVPDNFFNVMK
jgi:hypothetical protein